MTGRSRAVWAAVVAGLAGALLGAGVALWTAQGRVESAEQRIATLESDTASRTQALERLQARLDQKDRELAELNEQLSAAKTTSQSEEKEASPAAESDETVTNRAEDGRHFCFVTEAMWNAGRPEITVDYAQFLTGDAAAEAAAAAGEESPPPNDYFIVNENKKLRTFTAVPGQSVHMITPAYIDEDGYDIPLKTWCADYNGTSEGSSTTRRVPYWITVKGGRIVKIEEQYLP